MWGRLHTNYISLGTHYVFRISKDKASSLLSALSSYRKIITTTSSVIAGFCISYAYFTISYKFASLYSIFSDIFQFYVFFLGPSVRAMITTAIVVITITIANSAREDSSDGNSGCVSGPSRLRIMVL